MPYMKVPRCLFCKRAREDADIIEANSRKVGESPRRAVPGIQNNENLDLRGRWVPAASGSQEAGINEAKNNPTRVFSARFWVCSAGFVQQGLGFVRHGLFGRARGALVFFGEVCSAGPWLFSARPGGLVIGCAWLCVAVRGCAVVRGCRVVRCCVWLCVVVRARVWL